MIKIEESGPIPIECGDKKKFICGCGLTKNKPFCDGAHRAALDEEPGKTYKYNDDGTREEVQ